LRGPSLLYHGPFERLTSFSLINRRLAAGLRAKGWDLTAMASDRTAGGARRAPLPDVYLFHGHPYDVTDAPGRLNVFLLPYDYARFVPADRHLAPRLNACFDRLVAPSHFTGDACERSGVTIPIDVCPHGVDPREIHPGAPPIAWPSSRAFRFLYLGGVYERKGSDLLLRAYLREFTARDDVSLLVKGFSYAHLQPWVRAQMDGLGVGRPGAPEIVYEYGEAPSVAGYYTAAHVGVFPFRGEGFGLPVLECLASGRPVIVTRGCGPLDFCREPFARFLDARPVRREGREQLEPDLGALRRHMREAYQAGPVPAAVQARIHASVAGLTWAHAVERLDTLLRDAWARRAPRRAVHATPTSATRRPSRVAFAFFATGQTSWRKTSLRIDAALRRRFPGYASLPFARPALPPRTDVVVGQSGFCLEAFRAARDANPHARRLLHRGSGPLETVLAITNGERRRCGVPPLDTPPIERWRHREEAALADTIVVESTVCRELFLRAGHPARKVRVLSPGIDVPDRRRARLVGARDPIRFLFVGTDPFRKGARLLLEAWARLRPARAELVCVAAQELLASRRILRLLVGSPEIRVLPPLGYRSFLALYEQVDCVLQPSLEDGFAYAVAEGMARGLPAVVSTATGVRDLVVDGENGCVVRSGSVADLERALANLSEARRRLAAMGDAARATARQYPWRRFEAGLVDLVEER
jgi:glycosyltransferase involved in cell wall biosynthesis